GARALRGAGSVPPKEQCIERPRAGAGGGQIEKGPGFGVLGANLVQHGPPPMTGGAGGAGSGEVPRYSEILVDSIATSISMTNGNLMSRVPRPPLRRRPPPVEPRALGRSGEDGRRRFRARPSPVRAPRASASPA